MFTQDSNEIYFLTEMSHIDSSNYVDGYYSHADFSSTILESCESTNIDNNNYFFFDYQIVILTLWLMMGLSLFMKRFISLTYLIYSFKHISRSTNQSVENFVEPTTLVAHVSYGGNESQCNNWTIDNGSTNLMDGHHTEFFYMRSDRYVDGVHLKGLTSNTKADGIGSCIMCLKDVWIFSSKMS